MTTCACLEQECEYGGAGDPYRFPQGYDHKTCLHKSIILPFFSLQKFNFANFPKLDFLLARLVVQ